MRQIKVLLAGLGVVAAVATLGVAAWQLPLIQKSIQASSLAAARVFYHQASQNMIQSGLDRRRDEVNLGAIIAGTANPMTVVALACDLEKIRYAHCFTGREYMFQFYVAATEICHVHSARRMSQSDEYFISNVKKTLEDMQWPSCEQLTAGKQPTWSVCQRPQCG